MEPDAAEQDDIVQRLRAEASHAALAGSRWKRWDLVHVAVEAAAEIERLRAALAASPSEELVKQLRLADAMADSGAHSYTCALTVTDYEQGVECDCGWRPALDAYLAARAALRTTKEGTNG